MESTGNQLELPTIDTLLQILLNFLSGNNQKISEATRFLKSYTKIPECVAPLLRIMIEASNSGLRQLASILLKRNIGNHYQFLSSEHKKELRDTILNRYFVESEKIVRRNIGNLIGVIAKAALKQKEWNELLIFLSEKTHLSQSLQTRASGLNLLSVILDISGEYLDENYASISTFLAQAIEDQSIEIRMQALKCLIAMFEAVSEKEHIEFFQNLIDPCLKVIDECISLKDDETPLLGLDVFCRLAEYYNPILTDDNILKILKFICTDKVLLNENISPNIRECAMDFLEDIASEHKSIITKNSNLMKHIIECVFSLTFNKSREEIFEGSDTIQDISLLLLREFANVLPKKKIYPLLKNNIKLFMESCQDEKIEAGLLVLGHISEGCSEYLKRDLNNPIMTEYITKGLSSKNSHVRSAAIYALCYFSEFLLPEILIFHEIIIPNLINNFNDLSNKISERAIFTIDIFCENMEEEITQYLEILVPQLINTLDNSNSTMQITNLKLTFSMDIYISRRIMRRFCISAITSIVSASGEKFMPYAELTIRLMSELIKITDVGLISLRAEATSCLGKIAVSISKNNLPIFQACIIPLIDIVYDGLINLDDSEIREHSYAFFYCIARIFGEEFEGLLHKIVDHAFKSIESKEGLTKIKQTKQDFSQNLDSENEEEAEASGVKVQMSWLDEKAAAIHALGEFAISCYKGFAPYYEKTLITINTMVYYFYPNVRQQVVICYKNLTEALLKVGHNGQLPAYKPGLPCINRFPDRIEEFIKVELHPKLFHFLQRDESREVCAAALEVLTGLVKNLGPAIIDVNLDELVKTICMLLNNQAACQRADADNDDEEDTDSLIFDNLMELIPNLAKVNELNNCLSLKNYNGFIPIFKEIYPNLKQYIKLTKNIDDIAQVIGLFDEVFQFIPTLIQSYGVEIISLLGDVMELCDDAINRNIALFYGNVCELGQDIIYPYYLTILENLKIIYDNAFIQECSDNVIYALSKMIYTNPKLIPLNVVLPNIFKVITSRTDYNLKEQKVIIKMIISLFDTSKIPLSSLPFQYIIDLNALNGFEDISIKVLVDGLIHRSKYQLNEEIQNALKIILKRLMEDINLRKLIEVLYFKKFFFYF